MSSEDKKIEEIAKSDNYELLIDESCDIQKLLYYVCHHTKNLKLLRYLIKNYKEKINITPSFISNWYLNNDTYYSEIFDII